MIRNISKEVLKTKRETSHISELESYRSKKERLPAERLMDQPICQYVHPVRSEGSLNSSYTDLFETSGVVINDFLGSSSQDVLVNQVTYNLTKCKVKVVVPYYRLLCLIAWRPFGKEFHHPNCCLKLWNFIYTFMTFAILIFWYIIGVFTCQGYLVIDKSHAKPIIPTPNTTTINWTDMTPSTSLSSNDNACHHVFGTYIVPNILHFLAFVIGFYYFRIQEHEALYALMEKVYLQSTCPSQVTNSLRFLNFPILTKLFLVFGFFWILFSLGTLAYSFEAFGIENSSGIHTKSWEMYSMTVLIVLSGLMSNCVVLAVVLNYCGQCKLLFYYLDGVMQRLEEKSTDLKTAMKDLLAIKRHFNQLNGLLSFSTSCVVFNMIILVLITSALLIDFHNTALTVWYYRLCIGIQWMFLLLFILVQAASLTSRSEILKEKALTIRVFGYPSHTEVDIDSFLNFLNMTRLEAEIFTIPVKTRYLWGILIFLVQSLILIFQTGIIAEGSKWI